MEILENWNELRSHSWHQLALVDADCAAKSLCLKAKHKIKYLTADGALL